MKEAFGFDELVYGFEAGMGGMRDGVRGCGVKGKGGCRRKGVRGG
jgi:hypothetical protein